MSTDQLAFAKRRLSAAAASILAGDRSAAPDADAALADVNRLRRRPLASVEHLHAGARSCTQTGFETVTQPLPNGNPREESRATTTKEI